MRMCKSGRHDMDVTGTTKQRGHLTGHTCRECKKARDREAQRRCRAEAKGELHIPLTPRVTEDGLEELITWGAGSDSSYEERPGHRRAWLTAATTWMEDGACATVYPELFFPENHEEAPLLRGEESHENGLRAKRVTPTQAAKEVCSRCPVIKQCREYALEWEEHGVWGGMSAIERKRHRKAAAMSAA